VESREPEPDAAGEATDPATTGPDVLAAPVVPHHRLLLKTQRTQGFAEQHSNGSVCSSVGAGELTSKELDGVGALRPVGDGLRLTRPRLGPAISERRQWLRPTVDRPR
jgi:hypothetical protein